MEHMQMTHDRPSREVIAAFGDQLREAESGFSLEQQALLLHTMSQSCSRMAAWGSAELLAREGLTAARRLGDRGRIADALTRLGAALMDTRPGDAGTPLGEAIELYRTMRDKSGEARCLIDFGILHANSGQPQLAENDYRRAEGLATEAKAEDVLGLAALNAGVLYLKRGDHDQAKERFAAALRIFAATGNQAAALVARYNRAHLARECSQAEAAQTCFAEVVGTAERLGMPDVEIGARAGAGLAALEQGDVEWARKEMHTIERKLGAGSPLWFQCRELVDALGVRVAVDSMEADTGMTMLLRVLPEHHDAYAATWLLAECASRLATAGVGVKKEIMEKYQGIARTQGYAALSMRLR